MNSKVKFIYLVFFVLQSFVIVGFSEGQPIKKKFQEFNSRGGLPDFFEKALHGDTMKVAYFGGSITAQDGWRVYSLDWLKKRFPKAVFSEINAAIGGTGSDFGVFRLQDHVLRFKPDLVFVEFAVNDGGSSFEKIIRSMEGIVRQIWQQNPRTGICFIYTIAEGFLETEKNGQLPLSASVMEQIADHYDIPSINFGFEVSNLISRNQLIFKGESKELDGIRVFSPDGVHPYTETGHIIYLDVLKRSFETMISGKHGLAKKHSLPAPLAPDYFSDTKMIDFNEASLSKNWKIIQPADHPSFSVFGNYLNIIGKASQTGETLTVRFKGKAIGAYDIMGPDAGRVIVEVDGLVKDTIERFDAYCTYRRMNYFLIDHLEDNIHVVVFRVLSDPFDKASILAKRGEVIKNPDEFKGNNWYVGKILLDGKLTPDN